MIKLIDTHSHLYSNKFTADQPEVIERAKSVLEQCYLPNIDLESIPAMLALTEKAPNFFFPMMGLHPCSVKEDWKTVLDTMEKELANRKYWGIGETGLDYYWDKTFVAEQKDALRRQIGWAKDMDLPLILHCRDSMDDVIELVTEGQDGRLKGIFHCFTGTIEQAAKVRDLGFMMGIGGVITYKTSDLPETVKTIPLENLVLETDSPYLPPVPYRGKRNESSYTTLIARKLSDDLGLSLREISERTTENARRIFGND